MNELHLEYQRDTGNQVARDVDLIEHHEDFAHLSDYIKWMEDRLKDAPIKHSKHYYEKNRNK